MAIQVHQQSRTPGGTIDEAGAEKAFVAERNIAAIRLAVIAYNSLVYHSVVDHSGTTPWLSYLLIITSAIYGAAVFFFEPYRRYPVMLSSYFTSASDAIFITLWLYATGGFESPFYLLLYVSIVAVAFRYSYRETMIAAVIYALSYLAMLALSSELAGHLSELSVRVGYVFLIAGTGALFAREALQQTQAKLKFHELAERLQTEVAERRRMQAELAEAQGRLSESREAERLHLARELHDGPVQDLYGVRFQLGELREGLQTQADQLRLVAVQTTLHHVIGTLRAICGELRPPALAPFGLERAIRSHAEQYQKAHPELDVQLDLVPDGQALPERVRLALFRICQEALNNVAQHAQARSVLIRFAFDAEQIMLRIQDDGAGFAVPAHWLELARRGHLGMLGAAERAEAIGGHLEVVSAVGAGTVVRIVVPRSKDCQ
jgi:signal transduction histidine kinase